MKGPSSEFYSHT